MKKKPVRGGSPSSDALDDWMDIGRRLAAHDRPRFLRMLAIGRGLVATYETQEGVDDSLEFHSAMLRLANGDDHFDA